MMYYDEVLIHLREKIDRKRHISGELAALRSQWDALAAKVRGTMEQINAVIRCLDERLAAAEKERAAAKASLDELVLRVRV